MTCSSNYVLAQVDTIAIIKINAFTKYIDSISDNDHRQKFVIQSIEEGQISTKIVSFSSDPKTKSDTVRTIKEGGFSKYTIQNIAGDTVYRIIYHENIDKNFYETYYYKENKLIYAKIDFQENGIGQTFYYREEYFKNNKVLFVNESTKLIEPLFKQKVTFDLREKGKEYFDIFQKTSK